MAFWVELKCDRRLTGCCSDRGANEAMGLFSSRRHSLAAGLRNLEQEARTKGWREVSKGIWSCPDCLKGDAR